MPNRWLRFKELRERAHTHGSAAEGAQLDHGTALTGLTDDDHTQYQLESEKGAASGYASLDGSGLVPDSQIPSTITRDSELSTAATTAQIADIAEAEAAGSSTTYARGDHVHSGNIYVQEGDAWLPVTFSKEGTLTTGTGTTRWYNDTGRALTVVSARGSVGTAPTTTSILVDVNENGTSLWNSTQANRITIAATTNTDEGGAFDDSSLADGNYLTVDIDQIGSGTAGADLSITVWLK